MSSSLEVGDSAPDFMLEDLTGNAVTLSKEIGEALVVLIFYRGGWCPLCVHQLSSFAKDFRDSGITDVKIFAISAEQLEKGKELLQKIRLPFTLLSDPDLGVLDSYGILAKKRESRDITALVYGRKGYAIPSVFIIDRDGKVQYRYVGKSYRDRPSNVAILRELGRLSSSPIPNRATEPDN